MNKKEAAIIVRKTMQAIHCIDYAAYITILHYGVDDYYAKGKFDEMQRTPVRWFCELDTAHGEAFLQYVLDKEK